MLSVIFGVSLNSRSCPPGEFAHSTRWMSSHTYHKNSGQAFSSRPYMTQCVHLTWIRFVNLNVWYIKPIHNVRIDVAYPILWQGGSNRNRSKEIKTDERRKLYLFLCLSHAIREKRALLYLSLFLST